MRGALGRRGGSGRARGSSARRRGGGISVRAWRWRAVPQSDVESSTAASALLTVAAGASGPPGGGCGSRGPPSPAHRDWRTGRASVRRRRARRGTGGPSRRTCGGSAPIAGRPEHRGVLVQDRETGSDSPRRRGRGSAGAGFVFAEADSGSCAGRGCAFSEAIPEFTSENVSSLKLRPDLAIGDEQVLRGVWVETRIHSRAGIGRAYAFVAAFVR